MKTVSKLLTIMIIIILIVVPILIMISMFIWDSPIEVVSVAQAEYWDAIIRPILGFTVVLWWLASALKLIADKMVSVLYNAPKGSDEK